MRGSICGVKLSAEKGCDGMCCVILCSGVDDGGRRLVEVTIRIGKK
jgi:hypothetical protein